MRVELAMCVIVMLVAVVVMAVVVMAVVVMAMVVMAVPMVIVTVPVIVVIVLMVVMAVAVIVMIVMPRIGNRIDAVCDCDNGRLGAGSLDQAIDPALVEQPVCLKTTPDSASVRASLGLGE